MNARYQICRFPSYQSVYAISNGWIIGNPTDLNALLDQFVRKLVTCQEKLLTSRRYSNVSVARLPGLRVPQERSARQTLLPSRATSSEGLWPITSTYRARSRRE